MPAIPKITDDGLQAICDVLADTRTGMTGTEIGKVLRKCGLNDPLPGYTKRHRLFEALSRKQSQDGCANNVIAFIQSAMNPVLHADAGDWFESKRTELNTRLAFCGYELGQDGKIRPAKTAKTIPEAQQRADKLRADLRRRGVHPNVLESCRAELLADNYFHAVLEAAKSLADRLRGLSGCAGDGSRLVDVALGLGQTGIPILAINALTTDTHRSEHNGIMNLMKGVFGAFRNPTAHEPKISWPIIEQDALDVLTLVSLLHRRLDGAVPTGKGTKF